MTDELKMNREKIIEDITKMMEMILTIHEGLKAIYDKLSTIKKEAESYE